MAQQDGGTIEPAVLDDIINRLLEFRQARPAKQVQLMETEIRLLCSVSKEIFLRQPNLLELEAPIKICGPFCSSIFQFYFFFSLSLSTFVPFIRIGPFCCCLLIVWLLSVSEKWVFLFYFIYLFFQTIIANVNVGAWVVSLLAFFFFLGFVRKLFFFFLVGVLEFFFEFWMNLIWFGIEIFVWWVWRWKITGCYGFVILWAIVQVGNTSLGESCEFLFAFTALDQCVAELMFLIVWLESKGFVFLGFWKSN